MAWVNEHELKHNEPTTLVVIKNDLCFPSHHEKLNRKGFYIMISTDEDADWRLKNVENFV